MPKMPAHIEEGRTFPCPFCPRAFRSKPNLNRHKLIHSGEKPYSCELCGKSFARKDNLQAHMTSNHKRLTKNHKQNETLDKYFVQKPQGTNQKRLTSNHKQNETLDKYFVRKPQGKPGNEKKKTSVEHKKLSSFATKVSSNKPVKKVQPSCQRCWKSFQRRRDLRHHLTVHTGGKPYTCLVCTKRFDMLNELKTHLKCHTGEGMHRCDRCQKTFSAPEKLARHSVSHTGEKPYRCTLCHSRFAYLSHLNRHKKSHLLSSNVHRCKYCPKTFTSFISVIIHQKGHGVRMKFSCPVCQKRFAWHSGFKQHIQIHSRKKKKKKKVEKRSYQCETCFKSFPKSFLLKKHLESHLPSDQFSCHACDRSFKYFAAFREHMKWKHSDQAFQHASLLKLQLNTSGPVEQEQNPISLPTSEKILVSVYDEDKPDITKPEHQDESLITGRKHSLRNKPQYEIQNRRSSRVKTSIIKCEFCVMTFSDFSLFERHFKIHLSDKSLLCPRKSSPVSWET